MKERLTRYNNIEMSGKKGSASLKVPLQEAINRLAEYEDAEEQGLLVRLPCKVGDKVYCIHNNSIYQGKVDNFKITLNDIIMYAKIFESFLEGGFFTCAFNLGKTFFLTRAEAEKKLKEIKFEDRVKLGQCTIIDDD